MEYSYEGIILDANSKTTKRIGDKTMEYKIDEIFEVEGITLQAIETEDMHCKNCYFNFNENCNDFLCLDCFGMYSDKS